MSIRFLCFTKVFNKVGMQDQQNSVLTSARAATESADNSMISVMKASFRPMSQPVSSIVALNTGRNDAVKN